MAADPRAATTYDGPSPEERLESLRFFARESQPELPKSLYDWMQEVERQVANLRGRLNDLPSEYMQKGPVW